MSRSGQRFSRIKLAIAAKTVGLLLVLVVPLAPLPGIEAAPFRGATAGDLTVGLYLPAWVHASDGRSSIQLLNGMHANFVMRGFFKFGRTGELFWYAAQESVIRVKRAIPNATYMAALTAALLADNPRDTWANGTEISDSDFYAMVARDGSGNPARFSDFPNAGFFGDLASPLFREYIVGWTEKAIDVGADGVQFDGVYTFANYRVERMREDPNQVTTAYAGYFKMVVDEAKAYAAFHGRSFLAARTGGMCAMSSPVYLEYPALLQADDIEMCSLLHEDFDPRVNPTLAALEDFAEIKSDILEAIGRDVLIIAYIDWAGKKPKTQLSMFVQLAPNQRIQSLRNIDAATRLAGICFAYPVYGGDTVLGTYDSVKFGTYDAIVALATGSGTRWPPDRSYLGRLLVPDRFKQFC